jgi:hypothetical protein
MPRLIEHIDAIARRKQRDVLYLEFHPESFSERRAYRFEDDDMRKAILEWFDSHGIAWSVCGPYANPDVMAPYLGQVYIDLPFDESLPMYCKLRDYLEHPDGSMRHTGVRFCATSLAQAMKNAAHDEPGFWERWAEDF